MDLHGTDGCHYNRLFKSTTSKDRIITRVGTNLAGRYFIAGQKFVPDRLRRMRAKRNIGIARNSRLFQDNPDNRNPTNSVSLSIQGVEFDLTHFRGKPVRHGKYTQSCSNQPARGREEEIIKVKRLNEPKKKNRLDSFGPLPVRPTWRTFPQDNSITTN